MHLPSCLRYEALTGGDLTTLFGTTAEAIEVTAASPKKHGWMPLLTVLFLISYGLMTMLIMEQSQTIESQRALIHEFNRAGSELSAAKVNAEQAQAPVAQTPSSTRPSTQASVTQAPSKHAPSSQAAPKHPSQNHAASANDDFQMPTKPASDLADNRRSLITI